MPLGRLPRNDAQLELFTALFTDIAVRDERETMEVPCLSLEKSPRVEPLRFQKGSVEVLVTGGAPLGIANIWDWDLMMWLMSQIRQATDEGMPTSRKVRFNRHAFLRGARRTPGGRQYRRLEDSIARLANTMVRTTLRAEKGRTVLFHWIEFADFSRDENGFLSDVTVVLPEWIYEAVTDEKLVLSLHRDYLLLTGGLERWLYRFIRKGAGTRRSGWAWRVHTLHERSGSRRQLKYFARDLRAIVERGDLLDYELSLQRRGGDAFLLAVRKRARPKPRGASFGHRPPSEVAFLQLSAGTYERAKLAAPGYDIYALERQWKMSTEKHGLRVKNPDAAFLGYCRATAKNRPLRQSS